jgi:LemA protein
VSSTGALVFAAAAVLIFWIVGAYNRLVVLRNEIVALFAPLDEQFRARQQLLREQSQAIAASAPDAAANLEALQAALSQADAACAHARAHPGAAGAIASLRMADDILTAARARLRTDEMTDAALAELNTRIVAGEASLDFTRRQFNAAVAKYNDSVRQFPTWIVAAMFGFRPAGQV